MTECQQKIKELREITGMNRRQFCEAFEIPYRTVTEWERGTRNAPKYVLKFMEYYIQNEKVNRKFRRTKSVLKALVAGIKNKVR